jgi:hypothetical protein
MILRNRVSRTFHGKCSGVFGWMGVSRFTNESTFSLWNTWFRAIFNTKLGD